MTIKIAKGLDLPLNAVTQTFAFVGKRGSGKTYAAGLLVEQMLGAGSQVVVVDPVGNWWGLRLAADGESAGLAIPVFGGAHGDLDLAPTTGALIADLIVDRGIAAILDVSHFRKGDRQRFVTDFAEQLFHRKKQHRSALHIVFEESHVFVPQRVRAGQERMLGALEDIVRLGRNFGIGASLLDQRPQSVHKDVLNQTECLVALQLMGRHERKAIEEWVEGKGIGKDEADRLSELPTGHALVWSPQWLKFFGRVQIGRKKTFDASATPEVGAEIAPAQKLAAVDIEALRGALAKATETAKDRDPKVLRKRIAKLERELAAAKATASAETIIEVPVIGPGDKADLLEAVADLRRIADCVIGALEGACPTPPNGASARPVPAPRPPRVARPKSAPPPPTSTATELGKGPRAFLAALASLHPQHLTKSQLATLAGYKPRSSTVRNYLSLLRTEGLIAGGSDGIALTDAGLDAAGPMPPAQTTGELLGLWCPKIGSGPSAILRLLVDEYPGGLDKTAIADATGYSAKSSTLRNYLSVLNANGLLERRDGECFASDVLFPRKALS